MNKYHQYFLIVCILFSIDSIVISQTNDLACSGFVEFSNQNFQNEELNFAHIKIHLISQEFDDIVEETSCAQNGFYLLPISYLKNYKLKVVTSNDNYIFTPSTIDINLEGISDQEAHDLLQNLFNFKFAGFSIKGQIQSTDLTLAGPSGLELEILSMDSTGYESQSITDENGNFIFSNIGIGDYQIKAKTNENYEFQENEIKCNVKWGQAQNCAGKIIIKGVAVRVKVQLEDEDDEIFIIETQRKSNLLTTEVSNGKEAKIQGFFEPGEYIIKVSALNKEKEIEIEPNQLKFKVGCKTESITFPIQVKTFRVSGQVVDTTGKGIENVKILLDEEEKAITDRNGFYTLKKVTPALYTLVGVHDHIFFEPISDLKLTIGMKSIPHLTIKNIHLCGQIILNYENSFQQDINELGNPQITIFSENATDKLIAFPNENGQYCFEVKQGNYKIYHQIGSSEIKLMPEQQQINIINEPQLNVNFHRPKVSVSGEVKFISKSKLCKNTKIRLSSPKFSQEVELIYENQFTFHNILADKYELQIFNDYFCWEKQKQEIFVKQSNISNLFFKQKGFVLNYESPIDIKAQLINDQKNKKDIVFQAKDNLQCLEKAGNYQIYPNECYKFANENFIFNTESPQKLKLIPEKYLLQGKLYLNVHKFLEAKKNFNTSLLDLYFPQAYYLKNTYSDLTNKDKQTEVKISFESQYRSLVFEYKFYTAPNTFNQLEIVKSENFTQLKNKMQNYEAYQLLENLFFDPIKTNIEILKNCAQEQNINAQPGIMIEGEIKTFQAEDISNVTIEIYKKDRQKGLIKVGSDIINNKQFKFGPFIETDQYELKISKDLYKFKQQIDDSNSNALKITVLAQKLSTVKITVRNQETRKEIPGVLIFISSTDKKNLMRIQNTTDENGVFFSSDLFKGIYLVKAVLKEYIFEPLQTTIEIHEGQHEEIEILGKQVAFSIYGKIINLNKDGIEKISVQAYLSDKDEETQKQSSSLEYGVSDAQGNFRIRGLSPKKQYRLKLEQNEFMLYAKPEAIDITMSKEDVYNIEFIAFEKKEAYQISSRLYFDEQFTKEEINDLKNRIRMQLYEENAEEPLDIKPISIENYFEFENLKKKSYKLKISYRVGIDINEHSVIENFDFTSRELKQYKIFKAIQIQKIKKNSQEKIDGFSLSGPLFLIFLIILFFNYDKALLFITKMQSTFESSKLKAKRNK